MASYTLRRPLVFLLIVLVLGLFTTEFDKKKLSARAAQQPCPGTPLSRMVVGQRGRVTFTDGTSTRLREQPTRRATILMEMPEGTEFNVIGGPECSDGYTWWQLQLTNGLTGWSAEGDGERYFIEPIADQTSNSPVATTVPVSFINAGNELIAYGGNGNEIVVVHPDGTSVRRIPTSLFGTGEYLDYAPCPKLSPDGKYLAFTGNIVSGGSSRQPLVVVEIASGAIREITSETFGNFDWSPDSKQIAYDHPPQLNDNYEFINADGIWAVDIATSATSLLVPPKSGNPLILPFWSSDGQNIAFHEVVYIEGLGIFGVASTDGTRYQTWARAVGISDWSPDGKQLVYDDITYVGDGKLFIANADGSNERLLVGTNNFSATFPRWSPDGNTIAFVSGDYGNYSLWVAAADGGSVRPLLTSDELSFGDWSPDSNHFVVSVDGQVQIVSTDGQQIQTIGQGRCPSWVSLDTSKISPVPSVDIAFEYDGLNVVLRYNPNIHVIENGSTIFVQEMKNRADYLLNAPLGLVLLHFKEYFSVADGKVEQLRKEIEKTVCGTDELCKSELMYDMGNVFMDTSALGNVAFGYFMDALPITSNDTVEDVFFGDIDQKFNPETIEEVNRLCEPAQIFQLCYWNNILHLGDFKDDRIQRRIGGALHGRQPNPYALLPALLEEVASEVWVREQ